MASLCSHVEATWDSSGPSFWYADADGARISVENDRELSAAIAAMCNMCVTLNVEFATSDASDGDPQLHSCDSCPSSEDSSDDAYDEAVIVPHPSEAPAVAPSALRSNITANSNEEERAPLISASDDLDKENQLLKFFFLNSKHFEGPDIAELPTSCMCEIRNWLSRSWHRRTLQLVQGAGCCYLLRKNGHEIREVSVVTAKTEVETDGNKVVIKGLEPGQKSYRLRATNDNATLGGWTESLHKAIKNLIEPQSHSARLLTTVLESKDLFSRTLHTRTFALVSVQGHLFIERKNGHKLRTVSAVLPDTKVELEGLRELRIIALHRGQDYHLRFGGTECDGESSDRARWMEVIRTHNKVTSPSSADACDVCVSMSNLPPRRASCQSGTSIMSVVAAQRPVG
jgi:hypothetical protein